MTPEICFQSDKKIAFVTEVDTMTGIGRAWDKLDEFMNSSGHLVAEDAEYLGICHDMPKRENTSRDEMRYDAVVTVIEDAQPTKDIGMKTLAGGRYAVFLHEGPLSQLENTWQSIYTEWLPSSRETLRDVPPYERYNSCPAEVNPTSLRTEIFIPLE